MKHARTYIFFLLLVPGFTGTSCHGQNPASPQNREGVQPIQAVVQEVTGPPSALRDSVYKVITRFEKQIRRFESMDSLQFPAPGPILFTGSSSIRGWKSLGPDFAPLHVIGRGFGGSTLIELIHYAPRVILRYKPSAVVLYCGENDMTLDYSVAEDVLYSFRELDSLLKDSLPGVPVYFISIKPCPYSYGYWPKIEEANRQVKEYIMADKTGRLHFIDVTAVHFMPDGKLDASIFARDGIHINTEGYKRWTSVIKPVLENDIKPAPK